MGKIIAVDLDDTLCVRPKNLEHLGVDKYHHCTPLTDTIQQVNELFNSGNTIVIYTARGMNMFNGNIHLVYSNLFELTINQLKRWGVKYHRLVLGKIHYDLLIDDKCVRPEEL
jgi:hypothetical protein